MRSDRLARRRARRARAQLGVWPPLPPGVYARDPSPTLPFPLEEPGCSVFSRARHALWQGVQALRLRPGDEVLVPAYHHGSEIEALTRAGLGLRFYDALPTLEPDARELEALLGPRVRALYLIHYLGLPQDAPRWRAWCDERGLLLLEDAAQAWLATHAGRPVGSDGDLAIFCLYKTFGVPDGGALLVRAPAPGPESRPESGVGPLVRRHALWVMQRSPAVAAVATRARANGAYVPEEDFDLGDPGTAPTSATARLLPRVVDEEAAARRRANYGVLLDDLAELVPEPFGRLPAGASPFAFPIEAGAKEELLARLSGRGVRGLDFWSSPHPALEVDRFPAARSRRERTIALPVHQELSYADLERIAAAAAGRRAKRRRSELTLEPAPSLDAVRADWDELAAASENVFATYAWTSTWWQHFGGGRPLNVTACRRADGRIAAILPLYTFARQPVTILRFLGHGPADQLGPICAPEDRPAAVRALRRLLTEVRPDIFLAEQVPGDDVWHILGGRVLRREGSPVLRYEGMTWDEVLKTKSANLRQQTRRLERRLAREHDVTYRLADDRARLAEDFDTLLRLHSERWSEGQSAFSGRQADFHRDFAYRAFDNGWLRLWFLEVEGKAVSAWYGFRFGEVESYYQAGRDPGWDDASVGFVLLAHSIRAALEDGMKEYRFLRGSEAFKYRFANEDPGLATIGVGSGIVAEAALAATDALPESLGLPVRRWLAGGRGVRV